MIIGKANHKPSILIVDDNNISIQVMLHALKNSNTNIDIATDGLEAYNAARLIKYNLIITDYDMPHMTGEQLIREIKKLFQSKNLLL